jgi:hypothetical protein
VRQDFFGARAGADAGKGADLAETDTVAEAGAGELEAAVGADDGESGAANGAVAEGAGEHHAQLVAADDRRALAVERDQIGAATIVAAQDVDAIETTTDARALVGVQRRE